MIRYYHKRFQFLAGRWEDGQLTVFYRGRVLEQGPESVSSATRIMRSAFDECQYLADVCHCSPETWLKRIYYNLPSNYMGEMPCVTNI